MELVNSVGVITGAASGIGAIVARQLAKRGVRLILGDRDETAVEEVASKINDSGGESIGMKVDVTSQEECAALADEAVKKFSKLNIVIPCAGIIADGLFLNTDSQTKKVKKKLSLEKWQSVLDINLTGTFLTVRESAEKMVNGGWPGVIIPISSINKMGQIGQLNYSSSKASLALFPKILVGEFLLRKIRNLRVVGIAPGYVKTPLLEKMNQDALVKLLSQVHVGRLIEPDEIASLIQHIIENESLNGTTIEITGGLCFDGAIAK